MSMYDVPTSKVNRIIDAINRRYPREALGNLSADENAWFDSILKEAEDHMARYGVWPTFEMGEIEYDDPVLDIYGKDDSGKPDPEAAGV